MPNNNEVVAEVPSTEEIAQHYSAILDSVNLINSDKPEDMDADEWTDCLARNKEHLKLMVAEDFWTTEDMTTVNTAINA